MKIIEKKEFNEETITTDRWGFMEYISSRIYFLKLRMFSPKIDIILEKGKYRAFRNGMSIESPKSRGSISFEENGTFLINQTPKYIELSYIPPDKSSNIIIWLETV